MSYKTIEALLFDLDNTLYEYTPCNEAGKQAVFMHLCKKLNIKVNEVNLLYDKSRKEVHNILNNTASSHSRLLYIQKTIEKITGNTEINLTYQLHNVFWKAYFKKMKLRPGIMKLFKQIKANNIKIAIISDLTAEIQLKKIKYLKIDNYIDIVVTSEEVGVEKPDPKMINLALNKLKINKRNIVFVGDSMSRDKATAKKMNITFIELSLNKHVSRVIELLN